MLPKRVSDIEKSQIQTRDFCVGKLPGGYFQVCEKGSDPNKEETQLLPPDGTHNRQLACEIICVGEGASIVCSTHSEEKQQPDLFFGHC